MMDETPPKDLQPPAVIVKAEPRYVLGFPLIVSVTFDNPQQGAQFFELPELSVLFTRGSLGMRLQPEQGGMEIGFPPSVGARGPKMNMEPGEQREMLLDLSNFGVSIPPGTYLLSLTLKVGRYSSTSRTVKIEFAKPSPTDDAESSRLRRLGSSPTDTGAWAPFLSANRNKVVASPALSAEAQKQLALHLFLHKALYGTNPLASLDDSSLEQINSPILKDDVTVLKIEIQAARSGQKVPPGAQVPAGMRFRLESIRKGEGFLTKYRKAFGAEQEPIRPGVSSPKE